MHLPKLPKQPPKPTGPQGQARGAKAFRPAFPHSIILGALALCAALLACDADRPSSPAENNPPPAGAQPDFHLPDVNPNSSTHAQEVSPRAYIQKVSAWYFGHAT